MKSNKSSTFRWQTKPPYLSDSIENAKFASNFWDYNSEKEINFLKKLFSKIWVDNFKIQTNDYSFWIIETYKKWELFQILINEFTSEQLVAFKAKNRKEYLDTLFKEEYRKDLESFRNLEIDIKNAKKELDLSIKLSDLEKNIVSKYMKWEKSEILKLFRAIFIIPYLEAKQISLNEIKIKHKLNAKTTQLHEEIWRIRDRKWNYQELESTWHMKLCEYEKDLRSEKPEINVLIVEDQEKIRDKIINILSNQLGDYLINFREIDSFEEARDTIQMTKLKNYYIILDNNFYEKKFSPFGRHIEADMWVKLLEYISKYKEDLLSKIIMCSSDKDIASKIPANVDFVRWKEYGASWFIYSIAEKIRWKETKNPE